VSVMSAGLFSDLEPLLVPKESFSSLYIIRVVTNIMLSANVEYNYQKHKKMAILFLIYM
jgi:hypothetical protein